MEDADLLRKRAAMEGVADTLRRSLLDAFVRGKDETPSDTMSDVHSVLAHVSHVAGLAAERLGQVGAEGLPAAGVADLLVMLREIQNDGHLAYQRQHGSEADYQKIGTRVRGRFQTLSGKWRKVKP